MKYPARRMRILFFLLPAVAAAQSVPGGVALGMSAAQLQQADPAAARVPHPARLAGGLVGSWSGSAVQLANVALTPTFFFANGELRRVEYLAREGSAAGYAALLAWGRATWGDELASTAPEGAYASWDTPELQAYLQFSGNQLRLVTRKRVLKDAGEL